LPNVVYPLLRPLYGVTEAAVWLPDTRQRGFIHTGKPLSLCTMWQIFISLKRLCLLRSAWPLRATAIQSNGSPGCRDIFRETRLLERIIPISKTFSQQEISAHSSEDAVKPAIPNPENSAMLAS